MVLTLWESIASGVFHFVLGLVVKAAEVGRFGRPGGRESGYTTFARLLDAPGEVWRFSVFFLFFWLACIYVHIS